jgi:hypothetical protein
LHCLNCGGAQERRRVPMVAVSSLVAMCNEARMSLWWLTPERSIGANGRRHFGKTKYPFFIEQNERPVHEHPRRPAKVAATALLPVYPMRGRRHLISP